MTRIGICLFVTMVSIASAALARPAFSCAGFALLGGAQLICSHVDPAAPTQICTYSWALMRTSQGETIVQGSFVLTPGAANFMVYQGSGFSYALSGPIVQCQGNGGAG